MMGRKATKRQKIEDVLTEEEISTFAVCLVKLKQVDIAGFVLRFSSATHKFVVDATIDVDLKVTAIKKQSK